MSPGSSRSIDGNTLSGFAAILLWSTTIAFIRSLSEQVGPVTAAAAVYLIGGIFGLTRLVGGRTHLQKIRKLPGRYWIGCGLLFILYMLALYWAVGKAHDRQQVLEVGLLNYLWPALTLLFSLFILGKKARPLLLPGTLFALVGIFLVIGQGAFISWVSLSRNLLANPSAYSLGLAAAFSWALYSNLTRRWAGCGGGGVEIFIPATGIVFLILRIFSPEGGSWTLQAAGEAAFLGVATFVAYLLWDKAMREGDLVLVAAFSYLTPLFSTLVSCFYLGITASLSLWIGCLLIVAGSILSWISIYDPKTAEPP